MRKVVGERKRKRDRHRLLCKSKWNNCRIGVSYENQCHAHDWQKWRTLPAEWRSKTFIISNFIMTVFLCDFLPSVVVSAFVFVLLQPSPPPSASSSSSSLCSSWFALIFYRDHRFQFYRLFIVFECVCRQDVPYSRDRNDIVQSKWMCLLCDRVLVCNYKMRHEWYRWIVCFCWEAVASNRLENDKKFNNENRFIRRRKTNRRIKQSDEHRSKKKNNTAKKNVFVLVHDHVNVSRCVATVSQARFLISCSEQFNFQMELFSVRWHRRQAFGRS